MDAFDSRSRRVHFGSEGRGPANPKRRGAPLPAALQKTAASWSAPTKRSGGGALDQLSGRSGRVPPRPAPFDPRSSPVWIGSKDRGPANPKRRGAPLPAALQKPATSWSAPTERSGGGALDQLSEWQNASGPGVGALAPQRFGCPSPFKSTATWRSASRRTPNETRNHHQSSVTD